ncbi:acyl-CoA dehydrogenase family protein [Mycobacterium sp. CVI_P3]|uniref:Acyl-CoA dehydrogenase family protein n=1 Tax=Mycobacterium pinniadriaticum TaxID=2994102 RepID=A0ABT3SC29_9MYCO|nr:acyl-CoA dehydrogenase family protein [Mycobacterium pinniadriaticum]MCX2930601.1 acyl-CoA dehydrogenase family protein [Mycobacterium pinniadriaticum]MCX2937025.1 acyl-CoA dehydrogenase family protein [Mycobacterium pinniadriaticum]
MRFRLDDTEAARRDSLRARIDEFSADDMAAMRAEMAELESDRQAPTVFHPWLVRQDVVGLGWPEPSGRPATQTERFIAHEEMDSAGLPTYGLEQAEAVGWMLATFGPEDLAAEHLPHILDATWSYGGGYSEPEAGSDMLALRTKATRDPDGDFVVNGQKMWTSGAHLADWIFTLVRTDPDTSRHHGLSLLMIDARAPGVDIQPVRVMGGWRVNACFFDDVTVPARNLIGEEGKAWTMMSQALDMERSMSFGGREARLLLTRYLDRIGSEGTQLSEAAYRQIGEFLMELQAERLLGQQVVALGERGEAASGEASMSKLHGPAVAQRVAQWLVDELGPDAYTHDSGDQLAEDAEHFLRGATVLSIIGGTSEIQRNIIAHRWLGLPRG